MKKIKFGKYECVLRKEVYRDGDRVALVLSAPGIPRVAVATVNIPEEPLADDEVFIKNWSENRGILAVLEAAGVVKDTGRRVPIHYVEAAVCKLLI